MSTRARILLLLLFSMLILVVVAGVQFVGRRDAELATASQDLAAAANRVAEDLANLARSTAQLHYVISRARDLDAQDPVTCSAFLADVQNEYPQYLSILLFAPTGELVCDSLRRGSPLNVSERRYFKDAINARDSIAVEPVFSRLNGTALLPVAYAARRETGEIRFVLVASLSLEKILQSRSQTLPRSNAVIALVDGKGTILTWHPNGDRLRGTSIAGSQLLRFALDPQGADVYEDNASDGVHRIWATSVLPQFPEAGLHILVGVSKLDLLAVANRTLAQALATLLVVWLLVFAGAWLLVDSGVRRQDAARLISEPHEGDVSYRQFVWKPLAVFLVFTVMVTAGGYLFFEQLVRSAKSDAEKELTSVGKLKAEQIRYHVDVQKRDARLIAGLLGTRGVTDWLDRSPTELPEPWVGLLRNLVKERGHVSLLILDPAASVRFAIGQYTRISSEGKQLALSAAVDANIVASDIYPGDPSAPGQALMDIFVPILNPARARVVGVLVLRSNLAYLYALIQSWPVESRSAESVLVRRDGDQAVVLNEIRFRKHAALRMHVPLATGPDAPGWAAAAAARGETGLWEALDYRGQPILAYTLPVPETRWGLEVKVDMDDVLAPVQKLRAATVAVTGAFVLFALIALLAWVAATRRSIQHELAENRRSQQLNDSLDQRVRERTAQLLRSEERLRLMIDSVKDYAIIMLDPQGRVATWNEGAQRLHGYADEEVLGKSTERFYSSEEIAKREPARLLALATAEGRSEYEGWRVRKDETRFYADMVLTAMRDPAGELVGFSKITRDVTQRVLAEQNVQAQKERAEALLEAAPDPVVIVDREGLIVILNAQAEVVFGYTRAELLGRPVEELIPERLHATHVAHRAQFQEAPGARVMGAGRDLFARRKDGSEFAVNVNLNPLVTPDGTLIISTVRDVTERRRAEQRIRGQLEHLKLLDHITRSIGERQDLKSIFQVVVRTLEDNLSLDFGCICLHDPAAKALSVACVGVKSEAIGRELTIEKNSQIAVDENGLDRCLHGHLVYEPDLRESAFPFPQLLSRGGLRSLVLAPLRSESRVFGVLIAARRNLQAFSSGECEFLRQLSEHVALAAHQAQLYESLRRAYEDLRQTQQVVMQEERLRALGQMASGIAHDINNALSPVSLYTESLLETERNLSDRARGYLETIRRAVEDVAHTVARMREFYRQREPSSELTPVDVNQLVQHIMDLTRPRWRDMPQQDGVVISGRVDLTPDLPKVMGVEGEIREALTNLVFNAVDAMPKGGELTLRTRPAGNDPQSATVIVEVSDTGVGMSEETRRRCLEPFFTTKGERGTGLGLAMVFGTVQRHRAALEIDSAAGVGTTMRIAFPVPRALPHASGNVAMEHVSMPPLRLLVIDDDPVLLKSLRDALETDGHIVVPANGGEEGIARFRTSLTDDARFAAVITDLGMPHVDGRRVAAAVKSASPAMPVILLTGWGQRLVAEGDIPPHVDRVLAKPPKLRELREALSQMCTEEQP